MKIFFLTSGFPNGFTDDFIQRLKKYYCNKGLFVFIASDFAGYSKTDKYADLFISMFKEKGIVFDKVQVIDNRVSKDEAIHYLERADIVWISGGDTLKQISYIKEYGLIPSLQNRNGITIGMSAGSINMAKRVILPKDIEDNIPELSIFEGIGLVDINIEPHLDTESEKNMEDIYEATEYATIYGLFDNSFIEVVDDSTEFYGAYIKYEKSI
ncbi:Type 1 glutamine amidotransferase-like domain-containing protein [Proteiniborus sp. MB09-C3]|uniref:Type 1 glutamine amidotransferase-like domain-containing protein n=1 Tax=Proteiniborus sp. MB09-C3 TaxID=3050072 RepID=UPI0025578B35|nr:Type 1 glutamine amidotransferase-like domain-containing protein [Proteiniborus sp. MB09-C3]WIV11550.1 Type 1 glutamine amidotransferase-like domain-containing protein [Proteiniborus sp. MB09-C3]